MALVQSVNRMSKPFIKNSKIPFSLNLGGKIRWIKVVLTGQIVLSAGAASGTLLAEGGPAGLIKRIIVTVTPAPGSRYPGGKIVDCSPRALLRYAINQHNGKFIGDISATPMSTGAAGTYTCYLSVPIYLADSTLRNSYDTALNTDQGTYQSVQVEVDTGDVKNCFAGNDRTEDYSGLSVQVLDDRIGLPGVDTLVRYQEDHAVLIAAANTRAFDPVMPQDGAFESWTIMTETGTPYTLSDAILNRVMVDGPTYKHDKYAKDIRQTMLDDEWIDLSQTATGLYHIDFTDASIRNTVPAGGLDIKFDVNNPGGANLDDMLIFTRRVVAPTPAK